MRMREARRRVLTGSVLLLSSLRAAQAFMWAHNYGGGGQDRPTHIFESNQGGYIVVGDSTSFGSAQDDHDFLALRMDYGGNLLWAKSYPDAGFSESPVVAFKPSDGYMIAGTHTDGGTHSSDALLLSIREDGSTVLAETLGGNRDEAITAIFHLNGPDNYVLAGSTSSFGNGQASAAWITSVTGTGAVNWSYRYGNAGESVAALFPYYDGALVAGTTVLQTSAIAIERIDGSGRVVWARTYDGNADDTCVGMFPAGDGGWMVLGNTRSFQPPGSSGSAAWVLKLDETGNVVWQQSLTIGGDSTEALALATTQDFGAAVLARTDRGGMAVLRLSAQGQVLWTRVITDSSGSSGVLKATLNGDLMVGLSRNSMRILNFQNNGFAFNCSQVVASAPFASAPTTAVVAKRELPRHPINISVRPVTLEATSVTADLGPACPCATPLGRPNLTLARKGSVTTLRYTEAGSAGYDIIRGDLRQLAATEGDFHDALLASPAQVCLAADTPSSTFSVSDDDPPPGEGWFYLVRASNPSCGPGIGNGTYDGGSAQQLRTRDGSIALSGRDCD